MPAPLQIRLDVFGDEIVNRTLLRMGDVARDMRPAFRDIAKDLRSYSSKQFATQGKFGSGGWKPLDPDYRARKIAAGLDRRILQATHALRDSLTRQSGAGHIEEIDRDGLRFGSSVPYGKYHRKSRPPVQLPGSARVAIVKRLQRHIVQGDVARQKAAGS